MILCGRVIFLAYVVQEKQLESIFNAQEKLMRAILVSLCVNQCCYKRIEISSNTWPGLFLSPSQRFWQCGSNILDEHIYLL